MASDRKQKPSNSIPISFFDEDDSRPDSEDENMSEEQATEREVNHEPERADSGPESRAGDSGLGGPELAELVASRSGLKRLQPALAEAQEAVAPRTGSVETYSRGI